MKFVSYFFINMFVMGTAFSQTGAPAADAKIIATVLDRTITELEKDQLSGIIFGTLFQKYAKDNNIEPTDDELSAFIKWMDNMEKATLPRLEKDKETLIKELKSTSLTERQRKEKSEYLKTLENVILSCKKDLEEADKLTDEQKQKILLQSRKMAYGFVLRWKTNKSLFEKYGGRALFQQAGMEPIDAYRDHLKEQEQLGNFKIVDKKYHDLFWEYFLHPVEHFLQSGEEAKKAINTPLWEMEKSTE